MQYKHPHGHVFYRKMAHARPKVAHGEGIYLFDEDGNRYIDGSGGPLVVNVGHGRTEVTSAMSRQLEKVAYAHAIMFTSEPVEQLSAELAGLAPLPDARFFYLSSGSEVIEAAIKLGRQIQQARGEHDRHLIISRWHSYHGMSLGALSVSGRPGLRAPYLPMLHDMPHIAPPYPYRDPVSGRQAADRLEQTIQTYGAANVAAFLAEPISGASLGAAAPDDAYWPRIRDICNRYGVLIISDEVLVGMGRTGKWWGLNHWHVSPDIMVTSKGLAGGYFPFGFVAAKGSDVNLIQSKLGDFNHGGTFSHHAVGAAAARAVIRIMQEEKLVGNSAAMGAYLGQKLRHTFSEQPHIGDIRGRGLFWG
ncbi:MAG: aspartate aminotransferase family protein, partial [Anaerolineae bacterium]